MKQLTPLLIFLIFILLGCNSNEICLSNQDAVQVKFYNYYSTTDEDTTLKNVSIFGLNRTDSLYADTTISSAFLPLDFNSDPGSTSYVIAIGDQKDTIVFSHEKELDFISGECGYVFKFTLDPERSWFTAHNIDKVVVVDPNINYGEDKENVKIYIY